MDGQLRALSKILVVEDDKLLLETLQDLLEDEGYEVVCAINGDEALDACYNKKFDLYLLDINLPLLDGLTLLKELRSANDTTPAIFLTSHKEKEKLKEGFLNGADDYITKPFDNEELLLRIAALLSRTKPKSFNIGDFTIDHEHMQVLYKNEPLPLSKKEFDLLVLLLNHANKPVPKEQILEELWGVGEDGSEGAIRVYINRLKQLLPEVAFENIRGIGYRVVF